ncbi:MAG: hypothetical protein PHE79_08490 [Eubacteriales bacterium]|nr:hypothetical protein [Eubacteriales bacterium]
MIRKKFDVDELLVDVACDNNLADGDEIILTLKGAPICAFEVTFGKEEINFNIENNEREVIE